MLRHPDVDTYHATVFFWAFLGSLSIEIVEIYWCFLQHEPLKFPERYQSLWYWTTRIGVALIGGVMAVAYDASSPRQAFGIGAAAPFLLIKLFNAAFDPDRKKNTAEQPATAEKQ